jgi:hypothetical protein
MVGDDDHAVCLRDTGLDALSDEHPTVDLQARNKGSEKVTRAPASVKVA